MTRLLNLEIHYFNPHPPRGGRHRLDRLRDNAYFISIHTPREGGDDYFTAPASHRFHISIHTPREGGDLNFVSPCPVRRISIHTPREGGDHGQIP